MIQAARTLAVALLFTLCALAGGAFVLRTPVVLGLVFGVLPPE
jgi:hypothetical protein